MSAVFLMLAVTECYTITSLSNKYAAAEVKLSGDEFTFLMCMSMSVFLALSLPFQKLYFHISWQAFAAVILIAVCKMLEFQMSVLVLKQLSAFVDTIRAGSNNPQRHLLISGYNTGIDRSCDPLFKMPDDPADRMALSVHYCTPSILCILDKDASWGKAITEWGSNKELKELDDNMKMLKENYIDKGISVIVGEYGRFGCSCLQVFYACQ